MKPEPPAPQSKLEDVLVALRRETTLALVYEYLAAHTSLVFIGADANGPSKLLRMPSGMKCAADRDDVLQVEVALRHLASTARRRLAELEQAQVVVAAGVVAPMPEPDEPTVAPPEGEVVVDVRERAKAEGKSAPARAR